MQFSQIKISVPKTRYISTNNKKYCYMKNGAGFKLIPLQQLAKNPTFSTLSIWGG